MSGATQFFLSVNANSQVIVTLYNGATPPVPSTLVADQLFVLTPAFGGMTSATQLTPVSPLNLTIPAGQTQAIATFVTTSSPYQPAAVAQVAVLASTGPLSAAGTQTCNISIDPDDLTISNMCANGLTRPLMRDEIRRMISTTPPTDNIYGGQQGETPIGQAWPSNSLLNQMISYAIQKINMDAPFFSVTSLTIPVTGTTNNGVQWFPMQGVGGKSNQNVVNQILRITWDDGSGNPILLQPQSWRADDNQQWWRFNNYTPSVPTWYITEGYQIGLCPPSSANGTLDVWAIVSNNAFCSDTAILTQLPIDYQTTIMYQAVVLTNMTNPSRPDAKDQIAMYGQLYKEGVAAINKMYSNFTALQQNGLTFRSRRVQRWP